ncbi:MAG TPA: TRAP transporter substrate-binding protein [Solirubrobacterales bacterium]|nr:TRAP transporter substrate-binding protein [Solirubrobacterales bacterium]
MRKRSWGWRLAAIVAGLALALGLTLGLAACGGDDDNEAADTSTAAAANTLNLSYVTTAQHPYGLAVEGFAKEVNADGQVTINTQASYPQAESQLLADLQSGAVDMATISSAVWDSGGLETFEALQAPFLITNYPLEAAVIDGDIGKSMIDEVNSSQSDIVVLALHEGGLRKPFGTTPIVSLADWKGLTIRAPESKVLSAGIEALGANPDPIPLPDVNQALANGTVDGMEANFGLIVTQKLYEDAKEFTPNVNLWPFPTALAVNKAKWDSLTADQQASITAAAAKIGPASIELFSQPSTFPQDLVNCDVNFHYATPAQLGQLVTAGQTAIPELPASAQAYVTQIEDLKDSMPPPAKPPALPTTKTGACGSTG